MMFKVGTYYLGVKRVLKGYQRGDRITNLTNYYLVSLPTPIGYYVGNRLVYAPDKLWYW